MTKKIADGPTAIKSDPNSNAKPMFKIVQSGSEIVMRKKQYIKHNTIHPKHRYFLRIETAIALAPEALRMRHKL